MLKHKCLRLFYNILCINMTSSSTMRETKAKISEGCNFCMEQSFDVFVQYADTALEIGSWTIKHWPWIITVVYAMHYGLNAPNIYYILQILTLFAMSSAYLK